MSASCRMYEHVRQLVGSSGTTDQLPASLAGKTPPIEDCTAAGDWSGNPEAAWWAATCVHTNTPTLTNTHH